MGGGCGGLSLIGLLVGVGLTVWLGSMVMDGTFGGDSPKPRNAATLASVIDSSTTVPRTAAVVVAPASDLADGAQVAVTSDAFEAGTAVRIETCLARTSVVTGGASPCDATGTALAVVDERDHLAARYAVRRTVTVAGTPYDCASEAGFCTVTVTDTAHEDRTGSAPITFRAEARGPEITLPD